MDNEKTFAEKLSLILEKNKIITHDESIAMQKAFHDSEKEQFDDFLIEEGLVEESELLRALSEYYKVPAFDVLGYFFDRNLLVKFPKGFLLREAIVPLQVENDILSVVASNPDKDGLESSIRDFVSYDIVFMVGLKRDICDAVKEFFDQSPTEVQQDEDLRQERMVEHELEDLADRSEPVIKTEED